MSCPLLSPDCPFRTQIQAFAMFLSSEFISLFSLVITISSCHYVKVTSHVHLNDTHSKMDLQPDQGERRFSNSRCSNAGDSACTPWIACVPEWAVMRLGTMNPTVPFISFGSHVPLCEHLLELSKILVSKYVFIFFIQYYPEFEPKASSGI